MKVKKKLSRLFQKSCDLCECIFEDEDTLVMAKPLLCDPSYGSGLPGGTRRIK